MYYHAINFRWSRPDMAYWLAKLCAATWSNSCVHNTTHIKIMHPTQVTLQHTRNDRFCMLLTLQSHAFYTNTLTLQVPVYTALYMNVCVATQSTPSNSVRTSCTAIVSLLVQCKLYDYITQTIINIAPCEVFYKYAVCTYIHLLLNNVSLAHFSLVL